ncbi:MAG: conjugal transfer protein TraX [Oscillospiraceae bacterium]|jgi:hypothetical protein|nr:conjugal transfer protein TraX [Oscillospiraceae bacterium]
MPQKKVLTNQDTGLLGLIAVLCMIIDHVGAAFFPGRDMIWMRIIGRTALPLFAWGIVVGAEHTRNIRRYLLRLLLLMAISQIFYMGALNHWPPPFKFSIFATLALGLVAIWGLKEKREWMTVIALLLSYYVPMDYGLSGVLCILLLWATRHNPLALAVCFAAYCVQWGGSGYVIWNAGFFQVRLQTAAMLALPLMLIPYAGRTKLPRWLMYAAYPAHLAVIWVIKSIL